MQQFGQYRTSPIGSNKKLLLCAIVLIAVLGPGTQVRAQSAPARMTFLDSVKKPLAAMPNASVTGNSPIIARNQLTDAETQATIDFSIALKMRNFAELQQRIGTGEIIPLKEMSAKYLPTSADLEKIRKWLIAQGFEVLPAAQYELGVFARGTVSQLQQAFGVSFARVQFRGEEHTSAVTPPSIPAAIGEPVLSINGLQPHLHPKLHARLMPAGAQKLINNQPPYTVPEIAKAYNGNTLNVNGSGQKIGIVIDTFPANSDLIQFWNDNGINQALQDIENIQVVSGPLPSPSGEETLDVEWSSSIAPGAVVRVYACSDLAFVHLDYGYERILNDTASQPQLHQVSLSYGLGEEYFPPGQMQTDDNYFTSLASRGVNVFVSSGDGGATPGLNGYGDTSGHLQVENPASDPNVIAVGGTTLYLDSSTGTVSNELSWGLGGGGTSQVFARPSWQRGTGVPSGSFRLVPDVALAADLNTGGLLVFQGHLYYVGGTSWSAPTWAGICATINQARFNTFNPYLGRLNPSIYPLVGTNNFRDITLGSNVNYSSSLGGSYGYDARSGYDLCTGIGVPNVSTLLQTLAQPPSNAPTPVAKDFYHTGQADLLLEDSVTGERAIWILRNARYAYSIRLPTVSTQWHIAGIGDFFGTGQPDLVLENRVTGQCGIWILNGGIYSSSTFTTLTAGNQWQIVGAADFNGDGQADLVLENSTTGERVIWVLNNGQFDHSISLGTISTNWHIAGVGDFLGNGQSDLVWENTVTGQRAIWILNNGQFDHSLSLPSVGTIWHIAGAADFLGSGQADLVLENTVTGQRAIWVLNGGVYSRSMNLPTLGTAWHIEEH